MSNIAVVHHSIQGVEVCYRVIDGYFNATNMCKALTKQWHDFYRLDSTNAFVEALSTETGIPVSVLVETKIQDIHNFTDSGLYSKGQPQGIAPTVTIKKFIVALFPIIVGAIYHPIRYTVIQALLVLYPSPSTYLSVPYGL